MNYPTTPIINQLPVSDPLNPSTGRVDSPEAWRAHVPALRQEIVDLMYGGLPPEPEGTQIETLCHNRSKRWPDRPLNISYRIHCHGGQRPFSFCARVLVPDNPDPHPAIITGDGCWWYVTDELVQRILAAGCALVVFNRTELAEDQGSVKDETPCRYAPRGQAPDPGRNRRRGGLYEIYPDHTFGAISAWAWGYHRCVDLLYQLPFIDTDRVAISGHSRGGKTTLVAGATDERITLVNSNGSGTCGASLSRYIGHGGETLQIANTFPSWVGPRLRDHVQQNRSWSFDQHELLALMAPRPLLLTYALDDRWSNPEGMVLAAEAARPVYRLLGQPDRLAFTLRPGPHAHTPEDWGTLLDFINGQWFDQATSVAYNRHPYTHLPR